MTRRDALDMFLLSAFWGVSFLLIRLGGEVFPPVWVALLRSVFGAAVLLLALRLGRHSLPPARLWKPLLLVALFNNVIPWSFFAWGEQTVSSNIAAIINATTPLFALLIGLTLSDTRLSGLTLGGVLLGMGGVALTVSGGLGGGHATLHGVIILLLASLGYAVATTIAKRTLGGLNPVGLATTQLGLSSVILLPVALIGPAPAPDPDRRGRHPLPGCRRQRTGVPAVLRPAGPRQPHPGHRRHVRPAGLGTGLGGAGRGTGRGCPCWACSWCSRGWV